MMPIAAIIFVLVMLLVAYVAFRILKRTLKMAFRALIVLLILAIAIAGGFALWNLESLGLGKKSDATEETQ